MLLNIILVYLFKIRYICIKLPATLAPFNPHPYPFSKYFKTFFLIYPNKYNFFPFLLLLFLSFYSLSLFQLWTFTPFPYYKNQFDLDLFFFPFVLSFHISFFTFYLSTLLFQLLTEPAPDRKNGNLLIWVKKQLGHNLIFLSFGTIGVS